MSCAFDLDHFAELVDAARAGGYRFAHFDRPPDPGDLLLRHDVDLSLDAALRLGELESGREATATYFLMTKSVFYNLASPEGTTPSRGSASSATVSASTPSIRTPCWTSASIPSSRGTTPTPSTWPRRSTEP